jgi:Peptidase family M48
MDDPTITSSAPASVPLALPSPLSYQQQIVALLRSEEPELWRWHASVRQSSAHADAVRLELLKSTYRLDRTVHVAVYAQLDAVMTRLGLTIPATLYQAQSMGGLNASLWFMPEEVHLVLYGPLLATLAPAELTAVLAHELGHHLLWTMEDGAYAIADRVLEATIGHAQAELVHHETARRWRLFTELFCDRVALLVTGEREVVVRTLVRIETGAGEVDGAAYIAQARETLARGAAGGGISHPDCFIRALALNIDGVDTNDDTMARLVGGPLDPLNVDLPDQRRLVELTRAALVAAISPRFMRSEAVLAHARLFFHDFAPANGFASITLPAAGDNLRDYLCHLLLGVALADRELGAAGCAWLGMGRPVAGRVGARTQTSTC